jgi:hypothetical protein
VRLVLTGALFNAPDLRHANLITLLDLARSSRHIVELEDEDAWRAWLSMHNEPLKSELLGLVEPAARLAHDELPGAMSVQVEASPPQPEWAPPRLRLGLEDTLRLLKEPLGLLLENSRNDWNFLLRLAPGAARMLLQEATQDGRLAPLMGGGGTIVQEMETRAAHSPAKRARTFVLFDSDRLHPDELHPDWPKQAPEHAEGCGAVKYEECARMHFPDQHHRLMRRFIESYMPLDALRAWCVRTGDKADPVVRSRAFQSFQRLTDDQRWFYHMKSGFKKDSSAHATARQRDLYTNLHETAWTELSDGFGTNLSSWYDPKNYADELNWDLQARAEGEQVLQHILRLL